MRFLVPIDLQDNELLNVILQKVATLPTAIKGKLIFYTTDDEPYISLDGATWRSLFNAKKLEGQPGSYYLSRANHTGTQAPSTISPQGSGSNLDADKLDGMEPSTSATANTIAQRDSSGRIKAADPAASDDVATKGYVDANAGAVDKYAATITGDGATTTFTVTHNLGTTDVVVFIYDLTDNYQVMPDVEIFNSNSIQVEFATAPANGKQYRVIVLG